MTIYRISALLSLFVICGCAIQTVRQSAAPVTTKSGPEVRDVLANSTDEKSGPPRYRVMVLPFIDQISGADRAATAAREAFLRSMRRTDDFVLVQPGDFPKDTSLYLKNGEYELESMSRLGASVGLAILVEGKVLSLKAKRLSDDVGIVREVRARLEATVQLRVVSTKNAHVILNETRQATVDDATTRYMERRATDKDLERDPYLIEAVVSKAFQSVVPRIISSVEKLAWEGRVAMVKGDRIYLNAGRMSGLQVGDILKVTDDGEDVYDPETGALIGKVPGRLKGTVEVVTYFGKDGSIAIVHSGSGFRENDLVEVY